MPESTPKTVLETTASIKLPKGLPEYQGENIMSIGKKPAAVACHILEIPKAKPTNPPATGPSDIAAIITGTCKVVIDIGGIAI